MKTNGQWYMQLPEPFRLQALDNAERDDMLGFEANSLPAALSAFPWSTTPQGHDYWEAVFRRAEAGEFAGPEPKVSGLSAQRPAEKSSLMNEPSPAGPAQTKTKQPRNIVKRLLFGGRALFMILISPLLIPFMLYARYRYEHRYPEK
jgi:hypothetical protein